MAEQISNEITTIKLSKKTKQRLDKLKVYKRESYEEIVQKILDILNICRVSPERAQRRLILLERQMRRNHQEGQKL